MRKPKLPSINVCLYFCCHGDLFVLNTLCGDIMKFIIAAFSKDITISLSVFPHVSLNDLYSANIINNDWQPTDRIIADYTKQ